MTLEKTREEVTPIEEPKTDTKPKKKSVTQVRPSKADHYERLFQGGR